MRVDTKSYQMVYNLLGVTPLFHGEAHTYLSDIKLLLVLSYNHQYGNKLMTMGNAYAHTQNFVDTLCTSCAKKELFVHNCLLGLHSLHKSFPISALEIA